MTPDGLSGGRLQLAAYNLASSLTAYVTFTTAVSESVFTAREREREGKEHETQRIKGVSRHLRHAAAAAVTSKVFF